MSNVLKRSSAPTRWRRLTEADINKAERLYAQGWPSARIADLLKVSHGLWPSLMPRSSGNNAESGRLGGSPLVDAPCGCSYAPVHRNTETLEIMSWKVQWH